jgi:hypothetical protein
MKTCNPNILGAARLSADASHRYLLSRIWDESRPMITFIGLNPSRADAVYNDQTIRKAIRFTQLWDQQAHLSYGGLYFGNLYSFRTPYVTRPNLKNDVEESWEPLAENLGQACNDETDLYLKQMISRSAAVVCCWGSWNFISGRAAQVLAMIKDPQCFGVNKDGQPRHPLYLPYTTPLIPYTP